MSSSGTGICFAILIVLIFKGDVIESSPSIAVRGVFEDFRAGQPILAKEYDDRKEGSPILEERFSFDDPRASKPIVSERAYEDRHRGQPILEERFSFDDPRAGKPILSERAYEDRYEGRPILEDRSPSVSQQVRGVDEVELREQVETPMRELSAERELHTIERSSIGNGRGSETPISKRMDGGCFAYCEQMAKKNYGCSYSSLKCY